VDIRRGCRVDKERERSRGEKREVRRIYLEVVVLARIKGGGQKRGRRSGSNGT